VNDGVRTLLLPTLCVYCLLIYVYMYVYIHCVSKNDTDVAHYNFNAHQQILVIFARGIAK